ncbi:DNA mismatch repair endonuclease MutL [Cerasicoccus arenae]|uniref:DNA mismatch repair protein MutL n=1 Tax=Cerasicoccus arenae TaxID=424488 RepID=A0A8J3DGQ4_9BACT|nr:DNA mismatch repair endonuclease MutL [Cerasicoccus arenae]MBK1858171.1 DNA mismatch repair endonuclease MutL [Cerasicoccus arenae]GHB96935.1 DNA mismatch repair protein MutL [Cerasicoccus arenae]
MIVALADSIDSLAAPPRIRVLPDRVINQIAAGEVIERPAAVVKELVENSLDAGATRVEVEFRNGGKSYIRIEDNGSGMSPDDALIALERHATSKLREADDLLKITSLGFRGEALPSIASVSRFTLKTRRPDWEHGTEIFINGGKFIHQRECGMPAGTRIEVAHLFNSVPARRKFLKTDNTEAAHIVHLMRLLAVARPRTAFTLIEDGRTVFQSPECPTMTDRVAEIWGRQVAGELVELPVATGENGLRLTGLIGKPGVGRTTRKEMIALVNGRAVDSRTLNYALIEGYHTFIPKGRYPLAFLFLEIDPAAVDVNIHPAKREIRFRDEGAVRRFVLTHVQERLRELTGFSLNTKAVPETLVDEAARQADAQLRAREAIPEPREIPTPAYPITKPKPASEDFRAKYIPKPTPTTRPWTPSKAAPAQNSVSESKESLPSDEDDSAPQNNAPDAVPLPSEDFPEPASLPPEPRRFRWRFLGRLKVDYALFETEAGLTMLRLRAAHERIWFERIAAYFASQSIARQQLLFPLPLEFEPRATAALQDHLEWIDAHGFSLEEFGRNFYRLQAHPDWLPEAKAEAFLRDLVDRLREGEIDPRRTELAHEQLARLAATRAVRYDDDLPEAAITKLAEQLLECRQPLACPRGRPTIVELSSGELRKRFGLT